MRHCGLSRTVIAENMSYLLGKTVTEGMLNAFAAESRDDRRWPAEYNRAFCGATGDDTLLRVQPEMSGLHVIDDAQMELVELGRAHLQREEAEDRIDQLKKSLTRRKP